MKLTMLGTGNALVTKCYNTCFVIEHNGQYFLTDGGGGNAILRQLERAGYDWMNIRHIFVTHKHIDHLLGVVWLVRMICQFHLTEVRDDQTLRIIDRDFTFFDIRSTKAVRLLPAARR